MADPAAQTATLSRPIYSTATSSISYANEQLAGELSCIDMDEGGVGIKLTLGK